MDANGESGESWQLDIAIAESLTVCENHKVMDAFILGKSGWKDSVLFVWFFQFFCRGLCQL